MTLVELRLKKELTQSELSRVLDVDQTTVSKWESRRSTPKLEMMRRLSVVLECSREVILNCFDNKKSRTE